MAWRRLTGGTKPGRDRDRRTLIACSGGGDSSALVLALVAGMGQTRAAQAFVIGHVVHDLRPAREALADRDAAKRLAERMGLSFVEAEVGVKREGGNAEAAARRLRYGALARLARESGCAFVATAHHAEDQLESILMALLRGTGLRGLAGMPAKRPVDRGEPRVRVIRPMLEISRDDGRRVCQAAGWVWQEDATNADASRLRAALRTRVLPVLKELRPRAAEHAAVTAGIAREALRAAKREARELLNEGILAGKGQWKGSGEVCGIWLRARLQECSPAVLAELLRSIGMGKAGSNETCRRIARAIRSRTTHPAEFAWRGAEVVVTAKEVRLDLQPEQ